MTFPDIEKVKIIDLIETDSTNSHIKRNHENLKGDYPIVVFSQSQKEGRGRENRGWHSLKNKGLYCSIGIEIKNIENLNLLSITVGIAISEFLISLSAERYMIKWPNDILFSNKKIGGILIENIIIAKKVYSIIGIGLNINHDRKDFPDDLINKVISLKMIKKKKYDLKKIRLDLLLNVLKWLNILELNGNEKVLKRFTELSKDLIDKKISFHYNEKMIEGLYKGIGSKGEIIIEDSNKKREIFFSGEILSDKH